MIKTKKDVRFKVITETLIWIFSILNRVSEIIKKTITITSGNDSKHRIGSKHFKDEAIDIRVFNLDRKKILILCDRLREYPKVGLILFEWKYKGIDSGATFKRKADFNDTGDFLIETKFYYESENKTKVGHLHIEFIKGDKNG